MGQPRPAACERRETVLTAARVRQSRGVEGVTELFRELGYPVAPVMLAADEWRRAGIEVPWNGEVEFRLLARLRRLDLFLLSAATPPGDAYIRQFLSSYHSYNILVKSSIILLYGNCNVAIYDLSDSHRLRRLDVDLSAPSVHSLDRLNVLALSDAQSAGRAFDLALDRESVSRRFFERFRRAVDDVAAALTPSCSDTPVAIRSQALLILSRLLFLSFVQEKGWLNGERRFLFDRLASSVRWGDEFYATVLAPLFFGCLNTPAAARDAAARKLGRIPYLNGGLFEPSAFELRHPDVHLPNNLVESVIVGVFEKFDFSSNEEDAAGTHVDPEMLGKVFESLMAADERAATGSYYTPREIVDVMTRRAIIEWLACGDELVAEQLQELLETTAAGPAEDSVPRPAGDSAPVSAGDAEALLARLQSISLLDPACGSGAFLLSSLAILERLTHALSNAAGIAVVPDLRQTLVERSLFGVDLKPEAVRLCELRLWLAIVSSSDASIEAIRPLPNLDRNVLQGNSLFSPTDFLGDGRGEIYRTWMYALRAQADLIDRYRRASKIERPALARLIRDNDRRLASDLLTRAVESDEGELCELTTPQLDLFGRARPLDRARCIELQRRIADTRRSLEQIEEGRLDFFSFDVHFAQVMARGGFDVVAGNPPWVRNARIERRAKQMLSERYPFFGSSNGSGFHQPDLAVAFFERVLALASDGGVVTVLMPSKIATARYATRLRRGAEKLSIAALDDWSASAQKHFAADTFPLGITVIKRPARGEQTVRITAGGTTHTVGQRALAIGGAGSEWLMIPPAVAAIVRRLTREQQSLSEVLGRRPLMGVKTGENRAFFLGDVRLSGRAARVGDVSLPLGAICRCVRGRDLGRWAARQSVWMLWPPVDAPRRPPEWLERFAASRGVRPEMLRLAFVRPEHVGIKVAWKDVSRGMCAAVLPESVQISGCTFPLVPNQTLYSIDAVSMDEALAICAILNSSIADALLLCTAEPAKDAHFRYFGRNVGAMPFPRFDADGGDRDALVRTARRAGRGAGTDDLDNIVAKLYGVSPTELATLRGFVDLRLARDAR
jgi:hypothetical protein